MKKALFSGVVIISILVTQFAYASPLIPQTTQGTNAFSDVIAGSTYYNAVLYLKNLGVISGYSDGTFKPDNTINRAEFTKIVVEAAPGFVNNGLCMETFAKPDGTYSDMFNDVLTKNNAWYDNDLCYAKTNNWIGGYSDGTFRPNQNINFVEAAKIIADVFNLHSANDNTAALPWYFIYVDALASQKAIPLTITTFDQNITRGEMAEMIYRIKSENTNLPSQTYANLQSPGAAQVPVATTTPLPGGTAYLVCKSVADGSTVYETTFPYPPGNGPAYDAEGNLLSTVPATNNCVQTTEAYYNSKVVVQ